MKDPPALFPVRSHEISIVEIVRYLMVSHYAALHIATSSFNQHFINQNRCVPT